MYSWVPPPVRDHLLRVCRENLSPDGIAYVSYNTLPGWHLRGIVRDLMRYHALRFDGAERQIQEARLVLDVVAGHTARGGSAGPYAAVLADEAKLMAGLPDHYLYHEHLEEHCEPFYFHQFVADARRHGLDFFAESRLGMMDPTNLGPTAERAVSAIATTVVELEQFLDFFRNGTFRETLLRHAAAPPPSYDIPPARLAGLHLSCDGRPERPTVDLRPGQPVTFRTRHDRPIPTSDPVLKSSLLCLVNAFPASIAFDRLVDQSRAQLARLHVAADVDGDTLGAALLSVLMTSDLIEVTAAAARLTRTPGPRPVGFAVARVQAETSSTVTTARHDAASLSDADRGVLRMLDGTRAVADLAAALGRPVDDVPRAVESLSRRGLIVA